ncbi:type II toxin-antitoxin system HicA family toxin [Thermococcus sp.]|uniref:type II toxin-antitoxin system HicA family toxin n=1 Tax=Thermococcus sp. TaxID=35749 RepID=UPI0026056EB2|nr:type II toxin-antitoxin system HicA family toxin [Thermococcus sp.]
MSKLPRDVSGREAIKVLKKVGYQPVKQKGPHVILEGRDGRLIVVPLHRRLKTSLLKAIIKEAGLSVEEFTELLKDP